MAPVQQPPPDLTLNKYSLEYSFEELQGATRNFDPECKLGSGAFGAVFRGIQADGTEVAVKVLEVPEEAGFEEEVRVLSKFRHPNLVILMGFARHGPQRYLVYELLAGGDVYRRLQRSSSEDLPFPWRQRVSAAFDAACGLSHLHHATPKVFHRDIKSANILLDRNGTAKMADFGLACLSHARAHRVESAAGTVGYACPLYAQRRVVTEGSEIYSFGIVLLELLTASPPAWTVHSPEGSQEYQFLAAHIRGDVRIAMSLADPEASWLEQAAYSTAGLALRCIQMVEEQRPTFTQVVNALRKLRDLPITGTPAQANPGQVSAQGQPEGLAVANRQPFTAVVVQSPVSMAQAEKVNLWSLECDFAEGSDMRSIPRAQRTLVHCNDPTIGSLPPLKVGRQLQQDFFNELLPSEMSRSMVSREHFEISAIEVKAPDASAASSDRRSCSFFLTNLGRTWTTVNGVLLDAKGKFTELHAGDRVALGRKVVTAEGVRYTPFIQFRFSLAGSALCDALELREAEAPPRPAGAEREAGLLAATSLAGDVVPRFVLELGGLGLRPEAPGRHRRIVHGPAAQQAAEAQQAFAPLVLGRGHGASFWQRLLSEEALRLLPLEQLVLEHGLDGAPMARGLSTATPALVCNGPKWGANPGRPLAVGERLALQRGDVIKMIGDGECSLWLTFHDLGPTGVQMQSRQPTADGARSQTPAAPTEARAGGA